MLCNFILDENDSTFYIEESKADIKEAKVPNKMITPIQNRSNATTDLDFSLYEMTKMI